jgi:hypothetical protein
MEKKLPILLVTGDVRRKKEKKFEEKISKKFPGQQIVFLHLRDSNMTKEEMVRFFKNHKFSFVILKDCHDTFMVKLSNLFGVTIKDSETPLIPVRGEECEYCLENIIKGAA